VLSELAAHVSELNSKPEDEELDGAEILAVEQKLEDMQAPLQRFEHALHPFVAFLIMPLFALANSGVSLRGSGLSVLATPVALGTAVGLFVGKQLGIFAFTMAAVKLRLAPIPGDSSLKKLFGVSVVAGIGFTVALFIAGLAYHDAADLLDEAKIGILTGSLVAGVTGFLLLRSGGPAERGNDAVSG
jgi:NhaA family Na+:H+ antiporter